MGNLHLVTGYGGTEHITAEDHGAFNAATFGAGNYILNTGNKFAASVISNNQIRILDGELLTQGRHIRLKTGTYVDLTIQNGTQGYNRIDLIVARYTRSTSTGIEDCNLVVIKGTATTGTASAPSVITGDLIAGVATTHDVPLYRIPLSGITVGTPVALTPTVSAGGFLDQKLDGATAADYVVEQGNTNGWFWRKWQSGRKEIWRNGTYNGVDIRTNAGGFYYSTTYALVFPFDIKNVEHWSLDGGAENSSFLVWPRVINWGDAYNKCNIQFVSANGDESNVPVYYSIYIVGT